jgi:predicted TIM-barrel fold metal-dependent hydrolase
VIIDAHAHIWPDHIAAQVLAAKPVGLEPVADGTVTGLLRAMDQASIDMSCALAIANVARTVARTNEFVGGLDRSRLVPFGTVHPDLSVAENIRLLEDNGIRAVKLHPIFQQLSLVDPRVIEIMQALAERDFAVLTHAGAGGDAAATGRGAPSNVAALVVAVPDLTLIACHFGGYHLLDDAERELVGRRLVLETSWPPTVGALDGDQVATIIRAHGPDKVVFGSDWPMADPAAEMKAIRSWGLSAPDEAAVLGGNLARLLKIS